jgi:hypothetical protein
MAEIKRSGANEMFWRVSCHVSEVLFMALLHVFLPSKKEGKKAGRKQGEIVG